MGSDACFAYVNGVESGNMGFLAADRGCLKVFLAHFYGLCASFTGEDEVFFGCLCRGCEAFWRALT